jgi:hypothetical protein
MISMGEIGYFYRALNMYLGYDWTSKGEIEITPDDLGQTMSITKWTVPDIGQPDIDGLLATYKLQIVREDKIKDCKLYAKQLLDLTDYLVIRHRDEINLHVDITTLTSREYTTVLTERKLIRDKSNNVEALINAKISVEDVEKINIQKLFEI